MMKAVLLVLLLLTLRDSLHAQDRVRVEDADSLSQRVVGDQRVRTLVRAQLQQDETSLRARRATQYLDRGEILFVGDVQITERGDSLRADTVVYNTRTKVGRARGNVWLTDGEVTVMAPAARYDTRAKHAVFDTGVTLVDSSTTLRSRTGEYWSEERRAEFAGDVRLDEERSTLVADSITYLRNDEISIARGNVAVVHVEEDDDPEGPARTLLFGDQAYNENRERLSRMSGNPLLVQITADSLGEARDTLIIRSHELEAVRSDSLHRLTGVGAVRVWQARMAAVGDSLVFDRWRDTSARAGEEEARLFGAPKAWMDEMQLNGDTLRIVGRDGGIDTLFVWSRSFVARFDSTLERIHQIKGRDLTAYFRDDSLRTMHTGPNAEAIYFLKTDEDQLRGGVRGSGDEIFFRFSGGDLQRVSIVSGTEGEYTPAAQLPEPFQLDGFRWDPTMRPVKPELIGRVDLDAPFDSRSENRTLPVATDDEQPPASPDSPDPVDGADENI